MCRCHPSARCGRCDAFCALCLDTIAGTPRQEPLGRNDALVNVCDDCATQRPLSKFGPEAGYEANDPRVSADDARGSRAPAVNWRGRDVQGWVGKRKKRPGSRWTKRPSRKQRAVAAAARAVAKVDV